MIELNTISIEKYFSCFSHVNGLQGPSFQCLCKWCLCFNSKLSIPLIPLFDADRNNKCRSVQNYAFNETSPLSINRPKNQNQVSNQGKN